MSQALATSVVGKPLPRRDGIPKVTGAAVYVDDIAVPGCLYGKTLRTSIASGRIERIDFDPSIPWNEFTIVDAKDIPGPNEVLLIEHDQPILCDGTVRHKEEPILLIGHPDRGFVEKALRHIKVTYSEQPGIFAIGKGPLQKEYLIEDGDLAAEMAASDLIIERTYRTGSQEHVYIETNGFIAEWKGESLTVRGSLQCPYYVQKGVKSAFGLKDEQLNVVQEITGGGFGGKEEYPTILAIHAALLAKKSGKPVKLIYDRHEDMAASTKRHPSECTVRTGVMRDGTLRALEVDFRIDGGAYVTLSTVVLSRGVLHCFGPYKWPAARLHARSFMTNSPPYGAFRGFGAPQSLFAIETHMTIVAEQLGMDPADFRKKNFLHRGDRMPTGQVLEEEPNLDALLARAMQMSDYRRKRAAWQPGQGRGIGLSTFMHGAGFTGAGEVYLASQAALQLRPDGVIEVLCSNTDIGQGTETIFPQIVSEALGIDPNGVVFRKPETLLVPNSGPTVASRTTMVVGRLLQRAAEEMKAKLAGLSPAEYAKRNGSLRTEAKYVPPPNVAWDDKTYKGSAYGTYAWSVNIAEVAIDPVTAAVKVDRIVATVDIGTVINPVLATGQVEGGIAQAVGWATTEVVNLKEGVMANGQMTNYIIPTTMDVPEIVVEFFPNPYSHGAFGAKGVGELPMDGPGPAIAGAVMQATGREQTAIPITPESLLT